MSELGSQLVVIQGQLNKMRQIKAQKLHFYRLYMFYLLRRVRPGGAGDYVHSFKQSRFAQVCSDRNHMYGYLFFSTSLAPLAQHGDGVFKWPDGREHGNPEPR